jgi:oxygen-independent coproporphyrinogen-3 oxidase
MDHFALETDELFKAVSNGNLYRNFMGYTVKKGTDMVGLGVSAIGEVDNAFFQNVKDIKTYEAQTAAGSLVAYRGMFLSSDDVLRKNIIQALMCRFKLSYEDFGNRFNIDFPKDFASEIEALKPFQEEGSLSLDESGITILPQGRLFLRNIAMHFDAYLKKPGTFKNFSKTV